MPEQYDVAAQRHLLVGQHLQQRGDLDDAAYHFGVCGENAIKHALKFSGLEAHWAQSGIRRDRTPMRKHFPTIQQFIATMQVEIGLNATGRLSALLTAEIQGGNLSGRFIGWDINIRYADDAHTPVTQADCELWGVDAEELCLKFLVP